jgi:hypothetical protein
VRLVKGYVKEFARRNDKSENAIRLLCEKFPDNKNFESVLLKGAVINVLYSTQIRAIKPVAEHIVALNIDDELHSGEPSVVDRIARVTIKGKQRNNYSFSTKYCNFHNPSAYPIFDSFVEKILVAYQKQDGFARFTSSELRNYESFKRVLDEFRNFYGLSEINLKNLDMFLWGYSQKLFSRRANL